VNVRINIRVQINNLFCYIVHCIVEHDLTMNPVSHHASLAEGSVRLGHIDGGSFILAATAFQEEERDDDKVADGFHTFVEQERRGHHRRILATRLVVLVRADEASHGLSLGLWAKELRQAMGMSRWFGMMVMYGDVCNEIGSYST
jgi:hypothetical protein